MGPFRRAISKQANPTGSKVNHFAFVDANHADKKSPDINTLCVNQEIVESISTPKSGNKNSRRKQKQTKLTHS